MREGFRYRRGVASLRSTDGLPGTMKAPVPVLARIKRRHL
jgi:hypothetical protein